MSGFLDKLGLGHNKTEDEIAREAGKAHTVTHQKAVHTGGPGVVTTQTTTTTEKAGPTLRSAARTGSSSSAGWQGTTLSREQELAEQTRIGSAHAHAQRENIGESSLFTQHTGITGGDSAMTRSEEHLRVRKSK